METSIYDLMSTCRAVRRLRPDPIPDDVLARIFRAATWAPSGGNRQPWRIVAVREPPTKATLGSLYKEMWHEYAASSAKAAEKLPSETRDSTLRTLAAGDYLADHFAEVPVVAIFCFNPKFLAITDAMLDRPSVVGGGSVYPAVQNLLLACRTEGLGCVLTTLLCYKEAEVKTLLGIPDAWGTCACVPIGYPIGAGHGPVSRRDYEEVVYWDRWSESSS